MNGTLENGTNNSLVPNTSAADADADAVLTAVHSVNLVLGLPVNGYAMWLILSGAGGTMASEFFFLNLIVSVVTSPLASVFYFSWRTMAGARRWAVILFYVSVPSFQCCVCAERYVAVIHPVVFLRYKALRYRVACCCVVWPALLAFSGGFAAASSSTENRPTEAPHAYSSLVILGCSISLGVQIACISAVSFCCLSVLRALKQPGPGEAQSRGGTGGEGNGMKRRAFRIILISLIVMAMTIMICSSNYLNVLFKIDIPRVYNYITYALAAMSGFVHPFLYIHKAGKLPCFKELWKQDSST